MYIKKGLALLICLACLVGSVLPAYGYAADDDLLLRRMNANAFKGRVTYASLYDIDEVRAGDLKAVSAEMRRINAKVLFNFDTLSGNEVAARVTVNPHLVRYSDDYTYNFMLWTDDTATASYRAKAEAHFGGPCAVIIAAHYDFGMNVAIAAKLDIGDMDASNLTAYSYNATNDTYTLIENNRCSVDEAGFVHLQSSGAAGYIIITEA